MPAHIRLKTYTASGDLTVGQKQILLFSCVGILMAVLVSLWGASLHATLASRPLVDAGEDPQGTAAFFQNVKKPIVDILESAATARTTVQQRIGEAKNDLNTEQANGELERYQQKIIEELKNKLEQQ